MTELKSLREDGAVQVKKRILEGIREYERHHSNEPLKGRKETLYKKREETLDGLYQRNKKASRGQERCVCT